MIHKFFTRKNFKKAVIGLAKEHGCVGPGGLTKREALEQWVDLIGDYDEIHEYAERSSLLIEIDDEKDIKTQLKDINFTYIEIIKALLNERKILLEDIDCLYNQLHGKEND